MDANRKKRNQLLAEKVIKGLESRNMVGYYVETKQEALQKAASLIPKGSSVGWGGSASIDEIGLKVVLKTGEFVLAPGITDYHKRVQYQTIDVTSRISLGENTWTVLLADGWYRGCTGAWGRRNQYGTETKFFGQLENYRWFPADGEQGFWVTEAALT